MHGRSPVSRKGRSVALALAFLMFSPYLNVIPVSLAEANSITPVPQPAGSPLPPGTVSYQDSWNTTLDQACQLTARPQQPLLPTRIWSTSLSIPGYLFMGSPQGPNITQSFTVSANGTFSATDGAGNAFSLSIPVPGVSGTVVRTLVSNSTVAVLTTLVSQGRLRVAEVSASFSVYRQFCEPAGVRVEISGSTNWGSGGNGMTSILFNKAPLSVAGNRAWFGNKSGIALGFDWSDSSSLNPSFNATANSVSWLVRSTFDIDPVTVGTSTSNLATSPSFQQKICESNGYDWLFYFDGTNYGFRTMTIGGNT